MGINDLIGKSHKKKQSDISLEIGNSVVNNQKKYLPTISTIFLLE